MADWSDQEALKEVTIWAGQLDLSLGTFDTGITRLLRLRTFLDQINPDVVVYEEVRNSGARGDTQSARAAVMANPSRVIDALCATLALWGHDHQRAVEGRPLATLKKFATGKGNAGKEDMIAAANRQFGLDLPVANFASTGADNIADALFLCSLGMQSYHPSAVQDRVRLLHEGDA